MNRTRRTIGNILITLSGLLLVASAIAKLAHVPKVVLELGSMGFDGNKILFVAILEISSAVLFLVPVTRPIGFLLVCSYMGGAIAAHLQHGRSIAQPAVILAVVWCGTFLRHRRSLWTLASFEETVAARWLRMRTDRTPMPQDTRIKNAVVTGGTDGIGKEIAQGLARAGHRLILVGRDAEKGARAAQELLATTGNPGVRFIPTDLSSLAETERLARDVIHHFPRIDYLVHCAGIVRGWRELTKDGVESNFAVNFLSRFALTQRLLPALRAAGQPSQAARVVMISGAAWNGTIHFDDVNLSKHFSVPRVVSQFCAANDVFTAELSRRMALCSEELKVTITCLKIGVVKTNIRRDFPMWMKCLVPLLADPLLGQTPQEAASAALRLLLSAEFEGVTGALFLKIRKFKRLPAPSNEQDSETGTQLWRLSERLATAASTKASSQS